MSARRKTSLLYDPKVRSLFFQIVFALALIALGYIGFQNLFENYYSKLQSGKSFWDVMNSPSQIAILTTFGTWVMGYKSGISNYWTVFGVAISNTLIVAVIGIIFATIFGFLLGVFRLSSNFILRSFATLYVETLRNIPLLLQILFWIAIFRIFSSGLKVSDALVLIPGILYFNSDGVRAPFLDWQTGGVYVFAALVIAIIMAFALGYWAKKRQERTGQPFPSFLAGLALILLLPIITYFLAGQPLKIELPTEITEGPVLKRGAWESGVGMYIATEMWALIFALSTYTASFIAEIVRAGILAVPKGQTEAFNALGISSSVGLRKVILPQAMRVIIPPLTSQYLNLTKNSSLAAAVGYPEVVALFAGTILNQTGRAVEIILMVIGLYLTLSLLTSLFMNWFNNRMKLVER